jgi:imidazolonepropionase-like amidohydrolase
MRRMSIAILSSAIFFIAACASQPTSQPPAAAARATLYERARLITGDEAPPIEDSAFVVQDGKFTLVGRRGQVQAPEGAARVDLTGKTVMPGVIEAHAHLRVVAHTHALSDFKHLLRSGIDAFAHPTWRQTEVEPVDDELIALFKAHPNVPVMAGFWTPRNEIYGARPYWIDDSLLAETFSQAEIKALENPKTPSNAPQTWASGRVPRSMQRLKAVGVRFVLGTDMGAGFSLEHDPTPAYYGWSSHVEMESMVKAGLTPSEVITAATRNSAQILGLDQLGLVATGKNADFLVLDANPLDNIANTRRISRVYLRGGEVDRAALKKQLNGGSAAAARPPSTN